MSRGNIVLIGMPGCGKSTLGVVAAKMLCMDFLDVDLLIQKRCGMSLQSYIDTYGVDAFLELEADTLSDIDCENTVISTGGSAPLTERGAKTLSSLGRVVYISLPCEEIERRVKNIATRGIAMRKGETLRDIYNQRTPIYERLAEVTLKIASKDIYKNSRALADSIRGK